MISLLVTSPILFASIPRKTTLYATTSGASTIPSKEVSQDTAMSTFLMPLLSSQILIKAFATSTALVFLSSVVSVITLVHNTFRTFMLTAPTVLRISFGTIRTTLPIRRIPS